MSDKQLLRDNAEVTLDENFDPMSSELPHLLAAAVFLMRGPDRVRFRLMCGDRMVRVSDLSFKPIRVTVVERSKSEGDRVLGGGILTSTLDLTGFDLILGELWQGILLIWTDFDLKDSGAICNLS